MYRCRLCGVQYVALLAEGVDRNFSRSCTAAAKVASPSSRRAWIEIRNHPQGWLLRSVALLAEGVDRNTLSGWKSYRLNWSPSSRRAWIEIAPRWRLNSAYLVALLAEGVDRNSTVLGSISILRGRPPRGGRG